jgi:hypothetical protein
MGGFAANCAAFCGASGSDHGRELCRRGIDGLVPPLLLSTAAGRGGTLGRVT